MKTTPVSEARAEFSKLIDRAINGEPQRVTRYDKEAVIIVSEAEWDKRRLEPSGLGTKLSKIAELLYPDDLTSDRPWKERELGRDFE